MNPTPWNPAEFAYCFLRSDSAKRVRMWEGMSTSERKLYQELEMFRRFARSAGIKYSAESELTLDPNSSSPPPPDIVCQTALGPAYFELVEVVEESVAATANRADREGWGVYGGPVDLWRPVLRMFSKKRLKHYDPKAAPIDLVLYYGIGRQASFWPFLVPHLPVEWIQKRVDGSGFDAVWLYDSHANKVLARFARTIGLDPSVQNVNFFGHIHSPEGVADFVAGADRFLAVATGRTGFAIGV